MEKLDTINEAPLRASGQDGVVLSCPTETASSVAELKNEWHDELSPRPQSAMMRLYDEKSGERKLIGTTSFFRNRTLLRTVLEQVDRNAQELNVLVHAASIGCDVYSFAIAWELFFEGERCPRLKCFATDLSPVFLEQAKNAVYPAAVLDEMLDCEQAFFERVDDKTCRVRKDIRERVTILPAASYCEFTTDAKFDIVFILNSLLYVSENDQARTFDKIAGYNTKLLVTTGFHPERIREDLERNHYQPITDNFEEIYNGWTCRRSIAPGTMIEGITYCSPAMENLRPCPDYHFRFGALFKKQNRPAPVTSARRENVSNNGSSKNSKATLRVALFNDTGKTPHVGCKGVSLAHDLLLAGMGCSIDFRGYLGEYRELWKGDRASSLKAFWKTNLPDKLASVDAVIVNGEGTIHHGWGLDLLTILAGSQEMGIPTFLVNAVIQECEQDLQTLKQLTDFTVRDEASSEYLKKLGVPHRVVLDSIFAASFEKTPAHDFRNKIVVTDWHNVRKDVGAALEHLLQELGSEAVFYPLESAERERDWKHAVADLAQAKLVVTGRHHGVCLAGMAGVPFVALGSNTWKIEGMLRLLPGNLRTCPDLAQLKQFCDEAMANRPVFERVKEFLLGELPLKTFEKLAACPRRPPQARPKGIVTPARQLSLDIRKFAPSVPEKPEPVKNHKLCLATNYLLMTESTRRMWTDLGKQLESQGCQLVLLSTTLPEPPLPFPVFHHPYLMRDFIAATPPSAELDPLPASPRETELLKEDISRVAIGYSFAEALQGLSSFRAYMRELLRTLQPNFVLIADNMLSQTALMQRICWDNHIPVQIYERGLLPETLMVESRGIQAWSDLRTNWLTKDMPAADEAAYERIRTYYLSRKPQKYNQPDFAGGGAELRRSLGVDGKKLVVFLGGGYEANGHATKGGNYERQFFPAFPTTNDALLALREATAKIPNTAFIFKAHPLDPNPYAIARVQGTTILKDVNVHALIDAADVVAAQYTTLQFEAALYEKPMVLLARSAWWGRNATYEVSNGQELGTVLKAALDRQNWETRHKNAHAFVSWIMNQFLIGNTPDVPTRSHLGDLAGFISNTALDGRGLASPQERCAQAQAGLKLRGNIPAPAQS